jgi:hypothetical protein
MVCIPKDIDKPVAVICVMLTSKEKSLCYNAKASVNLYYSASYSNTDPMRKLTGALKTNARKEGACISPIPVISSAFSFSWVYPPAFLIEEYHRPHSDAMRQKISKMKDFRTSFWYDNL